MKKILLIVSLLAIVFSCEKDTDFCKSDECDKYFKIWKELFISRNKLSNTYFDMHVYPYRTATDSWNDGISFRVEYKIRIDWAEANLSDQFIIWLDPSTAGLYPSKFIPRSTYLGKASINTLLDVFGFSSQIHKVAWIDELKFNSRGEALQTLKTESGVADLGEGEVYYLNPSFNEDAGHPLFRVHATIDKTQNKCLTGNLDLVTGEAEVRDTPCVIIFN